MNSKVLLMDDEETVRDSFEIMLAGHPIEIVWANSGAKAIQIYKQDPHGFPLVVADYLLPDNVLGSDICRRMRALNSRQLFLFTSKHFKQEFLLDQLRFGANGFVDKTRPPAEMRDEVLRAISSYQNEHRLVGTNYDSSKAKRELESHCIFGRSQVMHEMLQTALAARDSKLPTLIVGETGTGKELVAKVLVPSGKRMVAISGANYVSRENMLESELFGYVKGAFTDAKNDTAGLLMQAMENVFFMDELHMLSLLAQAKLLRFLEEMKFRRVGDNSSAETKINFKLIAAVQPDIKQRIKDGRFLPDLIERVGSLIIHVPPLRERKEDIEDLVFKFQSDFNETVPSNQRKQFSIATIAEMQTHTWPTNVRGLKNAVNRMLTACQSEFVTPSDFEKYLRGDLLTDQLTSESSKVSLAEEKIDLERRVIKKALQDSRTRNEAAARVGMSVTSFLRKMSKLGIDPELFLKRL